MFYVVPDTTGTETLVMALRSAPYFQNRAEAIKHCEALNIRRSQLRKEGKTTLGFFKVLQITSVYN